MSGSQSDLRDARLRRALDHAPDAQLRPDVRTREAVRAAAHRAVAPAAVPWWRRPWPVGERAMPWSAALATVVLGTVITVAWQGREVPSAKPDSPVAVAVPERSREAVPDAVPQTSPQVAPQAPPPVTSKPSSPAPAARRTEAAPRPVAPAPSPVTSAPAGETPAALPEVPAARAPGPAPAAPAAAPAFSPPAAAARAPSQDLRAQAAIRRFELDAAATPLATQLARALMDAPVDGLPFEGPVRERLALAGEPGEPALIELGATQARVTRGPDVRVLRPAPAQLAALREALAQLPSR